MVVRIFLSVVLFCVTSATAQPPTRFIRAKVILGIMAAQIDGDNLSGYNKAGAVAGAAMEMRLTKKFSLQPEILYNQKGSRSTEKSPYFLIVRLNYIDINGLLNFYFSERVVIQAGLGYGLLFKARVDRGAGFVTDNRFFNTSDLGFIAGAEYRFTPRSSVNIRYGYSLGSISPAVFWYNNNLSFTWRIMLGDSE